MTCKGCGDESPTEFCTKGICQIEAVGYKKGWHDYSVAFPSYTLRTGPSNALEQWPQRRVESTWRERGE